MELRYISWSVPSNLLMCTTFLMWLLGIIHQIHAQMMLIVGKRTLTNNEFRFKDHWFIIVIKYVC